jgi:hypothetical protein
MGDLQYMAERRRRIIAALVAIAAALVAAHLALQAVRFIDGNDYLYGLTPLFDLDAEGNLPTLFSTVLLLACAALLAIVATEAGRRRDVDAWRWRVLAAGFVFLAVDEFAKLHELLDAPVHGLLGEEVAHGWLLYAWVVPYAVVVALLAGWFLPFLARLPARARRRFCIAGAVYVGAALGIEFLEGAQAEALGEDSLGYAVLTTVQEILEMAGLLLFLDALLHHVAAQRIALAPAPADGTALPPAP